MVELWGDIGFLVFAVSSGIFTILYLTMSRWYRSFVGSIIAVFCIAVVILDFYLGLRIWGVIMPGLGVEWLRLVIFWVLGIAMSTSVIGFLEVQFGRRGEKLRQKLSRRYDDLNK